MHTFIRGFVAVMVVCGCGGSRYQAKTVADTDKPKAETTQASVEQPKLASLQEVPGTGVQLRPTEGAVPVKLGGGFADLEYRVQFIVGVAEGDEEVQRQFRQGIVRANAEEQDREAVKIGADDGVLVRDEPEVGDKKVERQWLLLQRGDRAMAAMAVYPKDASKSLRSVIKTSLTTLAWNAEAPIDPEKAVGVRLAAVQGMHLDRSTSGVVAYVDDKLKARPKTGDPVLVVLPLPLQVPAEQRSEACKSILRQTGPLGDEEPEMDATIEQDDLEGCEMIGVKTEDVDSPIAAYVAVVFHAKSPGAFLVTGSVNKKAKGPWMDRFRQAARTLAFLR